MVGIKLKRCSIFIRNIDIEINPIHAPVHTDVPYKTVHQHSNLYTNDDLTVHNICL